MATQASKGKSVWVVGFPQQRLALGDSDQERGEWCPTQNPSYPCWVGTARAREDRHIHVELEGTRILRNSGATPHRQTVIIINNFNFS